MSTVSGTSMNLKFMSKLTSLKLEVVAAVVVVVVDVEVEIVVVTAADVFVVKVEVVGGQKQVKHMGVKPLTLQSDTQVTLTLCTSTSNCLFFFLSLLQFKVEKGRVVESKLKI